MIQALEHSLSALVPTSFRFNHHPPDFDATARGGVQPP